MQSTVELTGQTVFKIDGPGQQATDGLAADKGEIVEVTENEYAGTQVWIVWSEGNKEPYTPQTIKPASEENGLGVYLSEDGQEEAKEITEEIARENAIQNAIRFIEGEYSFIEQGQTEAEERKMYNRIERAKKTLREKYGYDYEWEKRRQLVDGKGKDDKDDAIKSDAPTTKDIEARLEELNQVTTTGDIFPCLYSVGIEAQDITAMRAKTVYDIAGNESTTYFLTFANGEKHLLFVDEHTKELTF